MRIVISVQDVLTEKYPAPIPKHSEKSKFEMKIEKKESKHDEEL